MTACLAPFVSMRLSPDGQVHTCGPNWEHPLGNVRQASLSEIWHGTAAEELRMALAADDFSLGCRDCEADHLRGSRYLSHAAIYDRFSVLSGAQWPRRIEFALSNVCNLQCLQCNGDLSSAIRSRREHRPRLLSPYGEEFFEDLAEFLPHLEMATFMGGEPFLARESWRVWDMLLELERPPEVHVTTNGTIWNERVERYVRALKMDVSVSLDGTEAATNDALRVGADFHAVRAVRDRVRSITLEYGGTLTLNFCLMRQNWQELVPFMLEAEEMGAVAYATRVVHPSSFSLFSLPIDEMDHVVTTWRAADDHMRSRLTFNLGVWTETLASFERHLSELRGRDETPVAISDTARLAGDAVLAWSQEFERWSSRPSLRLQVRGGSVAEVEVPSWAVVLQPESWIGMDVGGLLPVVEQALGASLGPPTVIESGEVNVWAFQIEGRSDAELRVAFVPWQDVRLRGIDVVINAVGAIGDSSGTR